jgi:hypothetical protein
MDQEKGFATGGIWLAPPAVVEVNLPQVRDLASLGINVEPGHVMSREKFRQLMEQQK